jgi:hypothetical protein
MLKNIPCHALLFGLTTTGGSYLELGSGFEMPNRRSAKLIKFSMTRGALSEIRSRQKAKQPEQKILGGFEKMRHDETIE